MYGQYEQTNNYPKFRFMTEWKLNVIDKFFNVNLPSNYSHLMLPITMILPLITRMFFFPQLLVQNGNEFSKRDIFSQ